MTKIRKFQISIEILTGLGFWDLKLVLCSLASYSWT
jgi:hypothetical protein